VNRTKATTDNKVIQYLVNRLPSHLKRIIFLASITAVAKDVKETDDEFIGKLNELMHLSNTGNNALKLPIYINKLIWSHKECIQEELNTLTSSVCDDQARMNCVDKINQFTPAWLKYADQDTIIGDLNKLFEYNNKLFNRAVV
jgi:hypothetical protein